MEGVPETNKKIRGSNRNKKIRFGSVFWTFIETTESNITVSKQTKQTETTKNFI